MTDYYNSFLKECALQQSMLLGNFNDNKYVISHEVIDELLKIDKQVISYKMDKVICVGYVSTQKLNFIIKFFVNEKEGRKFASLYLIEEYEFLNKKEQLETFLVNFNDFDNYDYFNKLKKVFNLYTKDESEGKSKKYQSKLLDRLLKDKNLLNNALEKYLDLDIKDYVIQILKILKKSQIDSNLVLLELKEKIRLIKYSRNSNEYWRSLKKYLDEILMLKYDKLTKETKKWLELVNQNYIFMYYNKKKFYELNKKTNNISLDKKTIFVPENKKSGEKSKAVVKKSSKKPIQKNKNKNNDKLNNKAIKNKKITSTINNNANIDNKTLKFNNFNNNHSQNTNNNLSKNLIDKMYANIKNNFLNFASNIYKDGLQNDVNNDIYSDVYFSQIKLEYETTTEVQKNNSNSQNYYEKVLNEIFEK